MTQSVHELKQAARRKIINLSLADDQATTVSRWVDTFLFDAHESHGTQHQIACRIMKLVLAGIAKGDFRVNTGKSLHAPTTALQLSDYISHASRVLFNLSELSAENKAELLKFFNSMSPRTSTHLLQKTSEGQYREAKSITHGAQELVKGAIHILGETTGINSLVAGTILEGPSLTDFGINIQMGGFEKPNLSEGFSQFGLDGHVLLHKTSDSSGLLIGLEQSAPSTSSKSGLPVEDDNSVGLSGAHSKTGASDDYTAAGSLYFSNLIYKLKLYAMTQTLTPIKYHGMEVKITDANFSEVMAMFTSLNESRTHDELSHLLKTRPDNATAATFSEVEFIQQIHSKDVEALFNQLESVELVSLEDQKLKSLFKRQIIVIKKLIEQKAPGDYSSVNQIQLDLANPHLKNLAIVIYRALTQVHQNYLEEATNTLIETHKLFEDAIKIHKIHNKYQLKNTQAQGFNTTAEAYFKVKSEIETYAESKEQNMTQGFKLCFELKKALSNLETEMATDEAQMLLSLANEIDALTLKIERIDVLLNQMDAESDDESIDGDAHSEAIALYQNEIERLQHDKEELIARVNALETEKTGLNDALNVLSNQSDARVVKLQSEKIDLESQLMKIHAQLAPAPKHPSFLIRLSQSIFDLDNLGFLSAAICIGLVISIFMPHMPMTLLLGLAAGAALTSAFCFFMASNSKEPTFSTIPQQEPTPF